MGPLLDKCQMYPVAAYLKQEAEHAALLARAAALKKKQSIEQEVAKLKAEQEQLEIDTAIAASFAKLKVFKDNDLLSDNKSDCRYVEKCRYTLQEGTERLFPCGSA